MRDVRKVVPASDILRADIVFFGDFADRVAFLDDICNRFFGVIGGRLFLGRGICKIRESCDETQEKSRKNT